MRGVKRGMTLATSVLAVGVLVAGCGSANTSNNGSTASGASATTSAAGSSGLVDFSHAKGTIVWAASPITTGSVDLRTVLIQGSLRRNIRTSTCTLQNQPTDSDTNRASLTTAIGSGSSHSGRVHGRRDLACAICKQSIGPAAQHGASEQLLESLLQWTRSRRNVQGSSLRGTVLCGFRILVLS